MTSSLTLPSISGTFIAHGDWETNPDGLAIRTGATTDHFISPSGNPDERNLTSARLLTDAPSGDFILSARVHVDFESGFDAGTLFVYSGERLWAKLCFEANPQVEPMVVSVVTRDVSDDANAFCVSGNHAYLRVSRLGSAYAFHGSLDGKTWEFVRFFALGDPGEDVRIGFGAQSPIGPGCAVSFSEISLEERTLGDLRDGS